MDAAEQRPPEQAGHPEQARSPEQVRRPEQARHPEQARPAQRSPAKRDRVTAGRETTNWATWAQAACESLQAQAKWAVVTPAQMAGVTMEGRPGEDAAM